MRRSLALLQENYGESESDTEGSIESSMNTFKDKPVSGAVKDINNIEMSSFQKSKLSSDNQDNSRNRMHSSENLTIFSVEDIPLPPDDFPMDGLQFKPQSFAKENMSSDKKKQCEDSVSLNYENSALDEIKLPSPLSPDTPEKKSALQLISDAAETGNDDKMCDFKSSKSSSDDRNDPPNSQVQFTELLSPFTDDAFNIKLSSKLVSFEEEMEDDDKMSNSLGSKSPVHEDYLSDNKEHISEESPQSPDVTSRTELLQFEYKSACLEGVDNDETSSSEDFKSYDHQDDPNMSSESRSQTALASLHETYTDSEGEVESDADEENSVSKEKYLTPSKESTPSSMDDTSKDKPQSKLVSYATEEGMDDDDMSDSEDSKSSSDHQDDSSDSRMYVSEIPPLSPVTFHRKLMNLSKNDIQLPPEPRGRCSKSLQEKISELYEKRKQGKDMNASIQKRKDFRNPSIYEKLIQFCNIDEQGTNYPPEIYDPHCWGPESYYEELAKRQKEEMDKREKEKKERTKVEFISGTAKKTLSDTIADGNKRKSKWDIGINQMPAAALKPATLITPTVLPVPTGTKPTVISAFGTISKKAKQ